MRHVPLDCRSLQLVRLAAKATGADRVESVGMVERTEMDGRTGERIEKFRLNQDERGQQASDEQETKGDFIFFTQTRTTRLTRGADRSKLREYRRAISECGIQQVDGTTMHTIFSNPFETLVGYSTDLCPS